MISYHVDGGIESHTTYEDTVMALTTKSTPRLPALVENKTALAESRRDGGHTIT